MQVSYHYFRSSRRILYQGNGLCGIKPRFILLVFKLAITKEKGSDLSIFKCLIPHPVFADLFPNYIRNSKVKVKEK
jgi:hypothetical protein